VNSEHFSEGGWATLGWEVLKLLREEEMEWGGSIRHPPWQEKAKELWSFGLKVNHFTLKQSRSGLKVSAKILPCQGPEKTRRGG
jgi:hypothetical protein